MRIQCAGTGYVSRQLRRLAAGVACGALVVSPAFAGQTDLQSAQLAPVLQGFLDSVYSQNNIEGISIAVSWNGGSKSWVGTAGYADVQHTRPITADTQFRIGSASKTITGTVVMRLADQGLINLDAPINTYVAGLNIPNGNVITVRNVMSMTSGLPEYLISPSLHVPGQTILQEWANFNSPNGPYGSANYTPEQLIQAVVQSINAGTQTPGAVGQMAYANTNFVLLGIIAQSVTGTAMEKLAQDLVFTPMGMKDSAFPYTDQFTTANYAGSNQYLVTQAPYTVPAGSVYNMSFVDPQVPWAAGAMLSTPSDELKWVREIATNDNGLLSASMQEQRTDFIYPGSVGSIPSYYGLALYQMPSFGTGGELIGHSGLIAGYTSSLFYNTATDFAYAINFLGYQSNAAYWFPFFGAQDWFAPYGYQIGDYTSVPLVWALDRNVVLATTTQGSCSFGASPTKVSATSTVCTGDNVRTSSLDVKGQTLTLGPSGSTIGSWYVDPTIYYQNQANPTGSVSAITVPRPSLAVFGSNISGVALQGDATLNLTSGAILELWGDNSAAISMAGSNNKANIGGTINTYGGDSYAVLVNGTQNATHVQSTGAVLGTIALNGSSNTLTLDGGVTGLVSLAGQGNRASIAGTITSPAVSMVPSAAFGYQNGVAPFIANTASDQALALSGTGGMAQIGATGEVDGRISVSGSGNGLVISGTVTSANAYLQNYIAQQNAAGTKTPTFTIPQATNVALEMAGTQNQAQVNSGGTVSGQVQVSGAANSFVMNGGMAGQISLAGSGNSATVGGSLAADTSVSLFALLASGYGNSFTLQSSGQMLGNVSVTGFNTVRVNGTLVGAVSLGGGSVLQGTGFVNGTVGGAGGVIAPGNSVGTLMVGNYVANGGVLQIETNGAGLSDQLIVTNIANITGGSVTIQPSTGGANGIYNILAASTVQGTFGSISAGDTRMGVGAQYSASGVNVATISPFQVDATTRLAAADTVRSLDVLERRAAQFQDAAPSAPGAKPSLSGPAVAANTDGGQNVTGFLTGIGPISQGSRADGMALWANAYGSRTRLYADGGVPTIQADGGGVMLGVDGEVAKNLVVGLMGTYSQNNANASGSASPNYTSNAYSLGAYASYEIGRVVLNGSVLVGRGDDEANQTYWVGGGLAATNANFNDLRIAGRLAASTSVEMGTMSFIPRAALTLLNVNVDSYTESSFYPSLNAAWSGSDYTLLRPEFTVTMQQKVDLRQFGWAGWLTGEIETGIARDVVVDSANPMVQLPGYTPIQVQGFNQDAWVLPVGARLSLSATDKMSLFAAYDGNFSTVGTDQSLRGGLQVRF
ncbi:MAG: hypothetical protein B7Y12_11395 [Rhizobiales bacterium 24-66-13]|nr:MAG: hypothetical protein B7Y12_11395 [Rhizobiales bacterium 24-66-13]HQS45039.1 serine hydrolase [Xanthobacteraceae bacterium]